MTTNNTTKKSGSRLSFSPEQIEERIHVLDQLLQDEVNQQFRIGDQLCVLVDQMKVKGNCSSKYIFFFSQQVG
jgi:hypothetical protein